jgi:pentatricopeptide repeat protein
MNVCIKSNEVQLAQEVYKQVRRGHRWASARARGAARQPLLRRTAAMRFPHQKPLAAAAAAPSCAATPRHHPQMLDEGCTPNLVTFNTLIDLYVKTGQWQEAIGVLDTLEEHVGASGLRAGGPHAVFGALAKHARGPSAKGRSLGPRRGLQAKENRPTPPHPCTPAPAAPLTRCAARATGHST